MKKICLLLALVMVLGCAAGCAGTGEDSGTDTVEESKTVTKGSEESTPTEDTENDTAADTTDDVTVDAGESTEEVTNTAADTTTEPAVVTPEVTTAPETEKKPAVTEAPTTKPAVTTKKEEEKPKEDTTKPSDVQPPEEPEVQFKDVKVGDYITFGHYEQDNDTSNGKEEIEWLVLDVQDGKALVLSKYVLDAKPYNTELTEITWENCTLRQWLNNDFINTAFTANERSKIPTANVVTEGNSGWGTTGGNDTQDKVFLLSINEVETYFPSEEDRMCKPTEYAKANGVRTSKYGTSYGNCHWWMRSPGYIQEYAACVCDEGSVKGGDDMVGYGYRVSVKGYGVRPALWVNIEA